ncbi:MAG TPA: NADH-quinone oxidoreductase subunit H [Chloroflexota bacterium]|nr:NADH-quinone oxidoreductase subunit H [Chloroflexota bacterium]
MNPRSLLVPVVALVFAPLLSGVIGRTKAYFAGRVGAPLWQPYHDLARLLRKGAVYSRTTSWVFRAGPVVCLTAVLVATGLVPLGGLAAPLAFRGDLVVLAYLLGLMRFVTVIAALDTGSSFEGMGASREVTFALLAEPAMFLGLAAMARKTQSLSLSTMFPAAWLPAGIVVVMVAGSLIVVVLAENSRIPVDDPNTHLELTMIHEVMVLDHSGPDLAFIMYGAALKLWVLGAVLVAIALPHSGNLWADTSAALTAMFVIAVVVGVIESCMARLRLSRVPHLLAGAGVLAGLAVFLVFEGF